MHSLQPHLQPHQLTDIRNRFAGGGPEEIHAGKEKQRIEDTWNEYPFPEFVLPDELVRLEIGLYGYYDFFEQET